jgi:hypothetical protein
VTIARNAPLNEAGWRDIIMISEKWKQIYFFPKGWTRPPNHSEGAFDDPACATAAGLEDQMCNLRTGTLDVGSGPRQMFAGNAGRSAVGHKQRRILDAKGG